MVYLIAWKLLTTVNLFWIKALIAFCLLGVVLLIFKFGLKKFRYKRSDLKAAGLNGKQRRQFLAEKKKKQKQRKIHF